LHLGSTWAVGGNDRLKKAKKLSLLASRHSSKSVKQSQIFRSHLFRQIISNECPRMARQGLRQPDQPLHGQPAFAGFKKAYLLIGRTDERCQRLQGQILRFAKCSDLIFYAPHRSDLETGGLRKSVFSEPSEWF